MLEDCSFLHLAHVFSGNADCDIVVTVPVEIGRDQACRSTGRTGSCGWGGGDDLEGESASR